jgi:hypothetical protein
MYWTKMATHLCTMPLCGDALGMTLMLLGCWSRCALVCVCVCVCLVSLMLQHVCICIYSASSSLRTPKYQTSAARDVRNCVCVCMHVLKCVCMYVYLLIQPYALRNIRPEPRETSGTVSVFVCMYSNAYACMCTYTYSLS